MTAAEALSAVFAGAQERVSTCRACQKPIPYLGVGRPRGYCDACRPSWFPPLVVKEVPRAVSVQSERAGRRRERRDSGLRHLARQAAARRAARTIPDVFYAMYLEECAERSVQPCEAR